MLLLVIFLFTFFKSSYLSAEYPQVVPSPSISHGRNNAIMREKECFVGKLCEYEILAEDFSCNVSEYVPSSGPERTLPKWLWLDKEVQTVKGIPSPSDEGTSELLIIGLRRHQYSAIGNICGLLTVKIVVWCLRYFPLFTRDIPTSAVIDGELSTTPPWKSIACQPNEPIVLASLVLAGNFHEMDGKRKINILDELLQNDHVSLYDVFILSSTEKETLSGLLRTSHVLGSGPGANRSSTGPSTTITWLARCGIIHLDDSLFQAIEQLAQRSVLINNIRYAPIGWHLVTGFQKNIRRKRNIVGTTTPAYSTIPISRATVITTRIKITRTRYVSQTRAITLSRPLPTFSSPFPANNTSLLNMSTTVTSQYSNTRDSSQHKNISSTLPVMSLTNTLFSLSQIISPSKRVTSEISQYESVNSISSVMSVSKNMSPILQSLSSSQTLEMQSETLPVVSQSTNKSILLDQISSSKQQVSGSKISHSTKMSFHLQSTLAQTRSFNLSTAFQSPSVRSSLTTIWNQRSTYTVEPSRRGITSSIPLSALQTATNTIGPFSTLEDSRGTISSSITTSLPKSEQHSISTFRISSLASSVKTVVVKLNYSTIPLQTSYSKYIDSVKLFSSRTYSPASQNITTSRIVNETKSTVISQTSYENSIVETRSSTAMASSDTITTTQRLETPSPSQSSYVTSLSSETRYKPPNPTSTSFLSCAQSRCESITRKLSRSSVSTASLYLTSSIARETIYKTSRITGTLVLKTAKETPQSSDMGKIYSRTLLTPRTVSTSLESSNYRFSKIIKTSESINPMMYSSRSSTMESSQISSSRAKSSQVLSEDRKESILASSSTEKSTSTGRTPPHITTELRSPHSRLIKHSPVSSISVQSRTIQFGSPITNIVPSPSTLSLFTLPFSGVISTSSSIFSSRIATTFSSFHSYTFSDHLSKFQLSNKTTTSTSLVVTRSQSSPDQQSASRSASSSLTVNTVTSSSDFLSYAAVTSPSTVLGSSSPVYRTPLSRSLDVTSTSSSHFRSSYKISTPISNATTFTSSLSYLYTPTPPLSVISTVPSSFFLSTYLSDLTSTIVASKYRRTSSVTTTYLYNDFSHNTDTSPSTIVASKYRAPSLSSSATTTSLFSNLSFNTDTSSSTLFTGLNTNSLSTYALSITPSYFLLTGQTSHLLATLAKTIFSSQALSTYYISTPLSSTVTTPSTFLTSLKFSYQTYFSPLSFVNFSSSFVLPTSPSVVVTTATLSDYLFSYHTLQTSTGTTNPSLQLLTSNSFTSRPTSDFTIINESNLPSSYYTLVSSSLIPLTSPVFLSSHKIAPISSFVVTTLLSHLPTITTSIDGIDKKSFTTASPGSTLSFKTPSLAPQTLSLSFLSSSTASSQPSITPELSIMMPSASSIYTSTKLLLFPSTRLSQPSYPSKQSPRTVLLTHTSAKMPAITSSPGQLSSTTSSQSSSSAVTSPTTSLKESPKLYNDFDSLSVNVGEVFSVKIPADTFHDREDGNTRNLRLDCLTVDHEKLPKDSWLQFNSTTQKLYGLILKNQLEGHSTEYILTASDNDGNTVYDAFSVNVERRTIPLAAIFSVRLTKTNLEMFNKDLSNILSIVQNIAGYYGDKDESLVRVESVTKGSVLFTWRNTTFKSCDNDLINDTASKLVTTQGNIQPDFYNVFLPKFRATDVFINYTGPCAVSSTKNPRAAELSSSETSPWLKYVLPVVLVAAVIIIIAVVLLVLRQHSGSKILKEDKQIFKRRKPTILDGELEMSTLSGKPIELPEDSLTPIRFPRETPLETPEDYEDDIPKLPSPILSAPSYQRLSPRYNDKGSNRYDSPPPSYRLPPSYYSSIA
ncbi:serine-rich adhesin for platelets-like isoform X1 [Dendronephthya gigantea]|uniref:serine-rich adhesin for platelets-like isoform X1 n=1 Tax=Dendronephthya gigantea TaxID=151771 RepID=UPI00106A5233|nr:serine-rich adhesin for platelets-like isoform X1 [Dendronephthya gigantea]